MPTRNDEYTIARLVKENRERTRWVYFGIYLLGVISGLILALFIHQ